MDATRHQEGLFKVENRRYGKFLTCYGLRVNLIFYLDQLQKLSEGIIKDLRVLWFWNMSTNSLIALSSSESFIFFLDFGLNVVTHLWQAVCGRSDDLWQTRLRHETYFDFLFDLSSWITCSGGSSSQVIKTLRKFYRNVYVVRDCSIQLTVMSDPPGGRLPKLTHAFRWLQHPLISWVQCYEKLWTKTPQLSHSQIPISEKLYEVTNVCCFKMLNLEILWWFRW